MATSSTAQLTNNFVCQDHFLAQCLQMVKITLGLLKEQPLYNEASAESNGPLRHPNSAQDTEKAVVQTYKSKSHSKTKDNNGPRSTSP